VSGNRPPGRYASIAVPVPLRRLFTYEVGPAIAPHLAVGDRVRVPFGGRSVVGTVVEWPLGAPPDP
jgi:primosomal protein N'